MNFKHLEDYGIIGNMETCAIIGKDGSIDWLCLPSLGSPSVFAALLDVERGGHFWIRPQTKYHSLQSYMGDTNILQTAFTTPLGDVVISDFMPVKGVQGVPSVDAVFRKVECLKGMVKMAVNFRARFNYAGAIPEIEPAESGLTARWQDEFLFFQSPAPLFLHDGEANGSVMMKAGDSLWFALQYNHINPLKNKDYEKLLTGVKNYWHDWSGTSNRETCLIEEPWHYLAVRSGLVLKLLSNSDTGAIAAAATTSLPEKIGGTRNWDYRYSWIRDVSFIDQALFHLGHSDEARSFRNWVIRIAEVAGEPSNIKTLYPLHGGSGLEERVLDHLSGYENSRPVRVGNAASQQRQLDMYGEMLNAVYDTGMHGEEVSEERWDVFRKIVDYVCTAWQREDSGIWEMRGKPRHFVYAKLMCWVAIDRGIKIATEKHFDAPLEEWRKTREEIKKEILEKGFSKKLDSFVQSFGSENVDATGLLIAPMGLLPHNDPMVMGTIDAVMKRLMTKNGLVYRYEGSDGLPEEEGCFLLCSFWLIKALVLSERIEEAEKIFSSVLGYVSPLGLLSEEVEPETGKLIGNFPQAFSHVGLINSALYLGIAKGRKHEGPKLLGVVKDNIPPPPE
ncbi:MAG: glycoside hydrolase family 15 protein [Nitrospiraceae bacterium]|nr:glycoside hydrolase family 15 protein [Nitrospiraceae bacterium]